MDEPPMSAAAGEQHIQTLRGLERTLLGLPDIVIDDAQLSKLGFRRGTALWNECDVNDLWKDCDTAVPIETPTEPVFFQPLPISYLPGIASQCVEDEMEPMNFCEIQHHGTMCPGWGPSFFSHMNFTASLVLPASRNCWRHVGGTPCFNNKRHAEHGLRYHGGSQHPHVYDRFQHGTFPIWEMTNMCHTNGRPHLITQLGDSSVATGDQVLRSELAVTISAMRHQMTCNGWDRHIVPVSTLSQCDLCASSSSVSGLTAWAPRLFASRLDTPTSPASPSSTLTRPRANSCCGSRHC